MAVHFTFISSFIVRKVKGKKISECKEFKKLKSTDSNNQREMFSKD